MKKKIIFAVLVMLAFGLSIGCANSSKEDYILSMKEVLSSKENVEFISKSVESTFVKVAMFELSERDKTEDYMYDKSKNYIYHYPTSIYGTDIENITNNKFQYPNIKTTFVMQDIENVYSYSLGHYYKANVNIDGKSFYVKDVKNKPILFNENDEEVFMQPFGYAKLWQYKDKTFERETGLGIINFYKVTLHSKQYYIALAEYSYYTLGFRVWIGDLY